MKNYGNGCLRGDGLEKKRKGERGEGKNLFSCHFLPKKLWLRGEES